MPRAGEQADPAGIDPELDGVIANVADDGVDVGVRLKISVNDGGNSRRREQLRPRHVPADSSEQTLGVLVADRDSDPAGGGIAQTQIRARRRCGDDDSERERSHVERH